MSESSRLYDLQAATDYLRAIGGTGVSIHTLRSAIASGQLTYLKIGKKFFVSRNGLDAWLQKAERRVRP